VVPTTLAASASVQEAVQRASSFPTKFWDLTLDDLLDSSGFTDGQHVVNEPTPTAPNDDNAGDPLPFDVDHLQMLLLCTHLSHAVYASEDSLMIGSTLGPFGVSENEALAFVPGQLRMFSPKVVSVQIARDGMQQFSVFREPSVGIIVAFRGTKDLKDWYHNLRISAKEFTKPGAAQPIWVGHHNSLTMHVLAVTAVLTQLWPSG